MRRDTRGFTLIELMIVVVIIGVLAAIPIPNFIAMQGRAKEGSTKTNMHTFQLAAEDYGVQNDGVYADDASDPAALLPSNFRNPFDQSTGNLQAWKNQATIPQGAMLWAAIVRAVREPSGTLRPATAFRCAGAVERP